MITEQREAIERLTNGEKIDFTTLVRTFKKEGIENFAVVRKEYLDTAISLIKQLESEKEIHIGLEHQYKKEYLDMLDLTKKYKRQIDLMAEQLAGLTIWDTEEDEPLILGDKEEVINYFKNKVKGE